MTDTGLCDNFFIEAAPGGGLIAIPTHLCTFFFTELAGPGDIAHRVNFCKLQFMCSFLLGLPHLGCRL